MHLPKVNLCKGFQELCPHQPIGTAPQGQHLGDQLQSQLTVATAAETHDTVLKNKAAMGPGRRGSPALQPQLDGF